MLSKKKVFVARFWYIDDLRLDFCFGAEFAIVELDAVVFLLNDES